MSTTLTKQLTNKWTELRSMTYDLMDTLSDNDLQKKLSFERSQDIRYQFWCMTGAQESWVKLIDTGAWQGFTCSLSNLSDEEYILKNIKEAMQKADANLLKALEKHDNLLKVLQSGKTPLSNFIDIIEHESHHQGQLINFIYAFDIEIPKSWHDKWALSRD